MAYKSGKEGYVLQDGVSRGFAKWSFPMKAATPKVNNFNGGGFEQFVVGLAGATAKISGPWDIGSCPFTLGSSYTFNFGVTSVVYLVATAIVSGINPANDVEGTPMLDIDLQINGAFTYGIV